MDKKLLFVIGDSVSIHYGHYLQQITSGKYNYNRINGNAGDSRTVLEYINEEKNKNQHYDVLLINCGLHDIRVDRYTKKIQIDEEQYRDNLKNIVPLAKEMTHKMIWVNTTPIIDKIHNLRKEGFLRFDNDVIRYNEVAKEIMQQNNVPIIDLYLFTKNLGNEVLCDHVHFKDDIRSLQGAFISRNLC